MCALVVEKMQLVGIEIDARGLVIDHRVVFPRIPQAKHDLRKLARADIAVGMGGVGFLAEVLGLSIGQRGHEIPSRAAVADLVQ